METRQNQKPYEEKKKSPLGYEVLQEPEKMWVYMYTESLETTTASHWDVDVGSEIHLLMIISKVRQWKKKGEPLSFSSFVSFLWLSCQL